MSRLICLLAAVASMSCESLWQGPSRRIDFSALKEADHIRVCGRSCYETKLLTIDDPNKVRDASTFISAYADGWRDSWNGPGGGELNFFFYEGERLLGGYGMTPFNDADVLMSVGRGSRQVPAREIAALMTRLGLQWPPSREMSR